MLFKSPCERRFPSVLPATCRTLYEPGLVFRSIRSDGVVDLSEQLVVVPSVCRRKCRKTAARSAHRAGWEWPLSGEGCTVIYDRDGWNADIVAPPKKAIVSIANSGLSAPVAL